MSATAARRRVRRLRVHPLLHAARCEWCDARLTPDVPALRRELAARADAVAGLRRDIQPRWLVARWKAPRHELLALQDLARAVMRSEPDEQLIRTDDGRPYMRRWWLHRPPADEQSTQAAYLHEFLRPDLPPPHDHPWDSASLVIGGILHERVFHHDAADPAFEQRLHPGDVVFRSAEHRHLLGLVGMGNAVTVFVTGARRRRWGFLRPDGTTGRDRSHGLAGRRAGT